MSKFNVEYIKETIVEIEQREYYARLTEQKKNATTKKTDTFDEDCRRRSRKIQEVRQLEEAKQLEAIMNSFDDNNESVNALDKFNNDDDFFDNQVT